MGSSGKIASSRIMAGPGEICWKRTFDGRSPSGVAIVGSLVACSHIDDQGNRVPPALTGSYASTSKGVCAGRLVMFSSRLRCMTSGA